MLCFCDFNNEEDVLIILKEMQKEGVPLTHSLKVRVEKPEKSENSVNEDSRY